MQLRIHIATDQQSEIESYFLIAKLGWHWERLGHRISTGRAPTIDRTVDVALLHVDRTTVPQEIVPANPFARPFLNRRVLDISKKRFSSLQVSPKDGWDGPVIIKSNLNHYGRPEQMGLRHGLLADVRRRIAHKNWRFARMLPEHEYPVVRRIADVPDWVWQHRDLIVERFIAEREGGLYVVRGWIFFMDRGYTYRLFSRAPVVKATHVVRYEFLGDPPDELVRFRQENGWDFGKFDYLYEDGRAVLLDANKTPSTTTPPDTPRLRDLAEGIGALF